MALDFDKLRAADMTECVDHYRIEKQDDGGGGWHNAPLLRNAGMRVAWEDSKPTNTVRGDSLVAQLDASMGVARSVDLQPDDWVVHYGYVYRVIRPRFRARSRWQLVALEYVGTWDAARQGVT